MKKNVKKIAYVAIMALVCVCGACWYTSSDAPNELFEAVENRDIDAVKKALETVDINATDSHGRTAIMVAAKQASKQQWSYKKAMKNLEIIDYLLDNGADLTVEDEDGLALPNYIKGDKFTYWKIWDNAKRDRLENAHWYLRSKIGAKLAQAK